MDLSGFAKKVKQGITLCDPRYIGGAEHVRVILVQANEYWRRGHALARNKSIDLLMRITCESQIEKALKISGLSGARHVSMFGLAESREDIEQSSSGLISIGASEDDSLLDLTMAKRKFLCKFHHFPFQCDKKTLVDYLAEKAVLLAFSK
jgi:tRNA threonylcarbamoyladenosine modification (KEOPS) complex Cgi121 subunit